MATIFAHIVSTEKSAGIVNQLLLILYLDFTRFTTNNAGTAANIPNNETAVPKGTSGITNQPP